MLSKHVYIQVAALFFIFTTGIYLYAHNKDSILIPLLIILSLIPIRMLSYYTNQQHNRINDKIKSINKYIDPDSLCTIEHPKKDR